MYVERVAHIQAPGVEFLVHSRSESHCLFMLPRTLCYTAPLSTPLLVMPQPTKDLSSHLFWYHL